MCRARLWRPRSSGACWPVSAPAGEHSWLVLFGLKYCVYLLAQRCVATSIGKSSTLCQHCALPCCRDGLAVALGQRLVLLHGLGNAGGAGGSTAVGSKRSSCGSGGGGAGAAIEFVSAVDAPETITALCWLAGSGQSAGKQRASLPGALYSGLAALERCLQRLLFCMSCWA